MTKLNPCPLCGNEPDLTVYSGYINGVVCICGLAVEVGATTGDAAINGWNDVTANFTQPAKTLRDEFAMAAMQAIRSGPEWQLLEMKSIVAGNSDLNLEGVISHFAYKQADEMLKERST